MKKWKMARKPSIWERANRPRKIAGFNSVEKVTVLAIIMLAIIFIPSYAYYVNIVQPSLPQPRNLNNDPFTNLWNGTTVTLGSELSSSSQIVTQTAVPTTDTSVNYGGGFQGPLSLIWGECFT